MDRRILEEHQRVLSTLAKSIANKDVRIDKFRGYENEDITRWFRTLPAESLRSFLDKSGKRKRLCRHLQVPLICRSSSSLDESDKFYTG